MMSDSDKALIGDLKLAEDARLLFRELGFAIELWEALRLARTETVTLTCEMERLQKLRKQGRSPSLGGLMIDSIDQMRKKLQQRVRNSQPSSLGSFASWGFGSKRRPGMR